MAASQDKTDLLAKVKNAFLTMTSPSGYGTDVRLFCTIHTVNIPPMAGRADAAYERACAILRSNILVLPDEERHRRYEDLVTLFGTASKQCRIAEANLKRAGKDLPIHEISVYFEYLLKMSQSLLNIMKFRSATQTADPVLKDMLGKVLITGAQTPEDVLEDTELQLSHAMLDFVTANDPAVSKQRNRFKRLLQKTELERYNNAYQEYVRYYSKVGVSA